MDKLILIFFFIGWIIIVCFVWGEFLLFCFREFVLAVKMIGIKNYYIIFFYILLNVLGLIIVLVILKVGMVILVEFILSYFGFGI